MTPPGTTPDGGPYVASVALTPPPRRLPDEPVRFTNLNRGRDRWRAVAALALVGAALVGLLAWWGDPLALPTTSAEMVNRDLLGIQPAGGVQVGAATVTKYDCKVGPSWARRTLRFAGDRTHAELMVRRALSRRVVDGRRQGSETGSRRLGIELRHQ